MSHTISTFEHIILAGGCFWGVQHFFSLVPGVTNTQACYVNGTKENPTYQEVCSARYGFAEAVTVEFNKEKITLSALLDKFFLIIDPVSLNKQGNDRGLQYRTGIYCHNAEQLGEVQNKLDELQKRTEKTIVVECKMTENFYPAELNHQDYLEKNPNGYCHLPLSVFELAKE